MFNNDTLEILQASQEPPRCYPTRLHGLDPLARTGGDYWGGISRPMLLPHRDLRASLLCLFATDPSGMPLVCSGPVERLPAFPFRTENQSRRSTTQRACQRWVVLDYSCSPKAVGLAD